MRTLFVQLKIGKAFGVTAIDQVSGCGTVIMRKERCADG
jgi:hypothetical protein